MVFIIIFLVICIILFIFCMWGLSLSLKNEFKKRKLQKTADYNFKTKNGHYSFIYIFKSFAAENGKELKLALQPVLGFSDLSTASTNRWQTIKFELKDNISGQELLYDKQQPEFDPKKNPLFINASVNIPSSMLNENNVADVHIKVISSWTLGGNTIDEVFEFDFKK